VVARSQLAASQVSLVVTFLPSFLLSGFLFPIEQMPAPIRAITAMFPARYYVSLLRDVFLKEKPMRWLAPDLGVLFVFAVVLTTIATRVFHKTAAR
jgi:ABC-2 type transport system permease protein